MSDSEFIHERRPSWRVIRAMAAELQRQRRTLSTVNEDGHIEVTGPIDLAHLAHITEQAITREFRR